MINVGRNDLKVVDPRKSVEISVIIPVHNAAATLGDCLEALFNSSFLDFECIVVDDSSTDASKEIAQVYPLQIVELDGRARGPGYARNLGAQAASGRVVFFIDSDVKVRPDTLEIVAGTFDQHPEYSAVFGSYDDDPMHGGFVSQYKNLSHTFVHQNSREEASTFWSGCGAFDRVKFLELGGFDDIRYPRPSIEDIELGSRLIKSGGRILLNKNIKVKHLKRWSFTGLLKTDIKSRGIPWTILLLRDRTIPDDLNLNKGQRASALLAGLIGLVFIFNLPDPNVIFFPFAIGLLLSVTNLFEWHARPKAAQFNLTSVLPTWFFIGIGLIFGAFRQSYVIAIPLALLFLVSLASSVMAKAGALPQLLYAGIIFFLSGFVCLVVFISAPVYFTLPVTALLAGIVWLNREYFGYLKKWRGLVFAIASVPMQIIYYYYSLLSFAIGYGIYHLERVVPSQNVSKG